MMIFRSKVAEVEIEWALERERSLVERGEAAGDLHDPAVLPFRETIDRANEATDLILHS